MKNALLIVSLTLLLAGCVDEFNSSEINQDHNINQENSMLNENYVLVTKASDLPNTSSIYPAPGSSNFSTTGIVSFEFSEDWEYMKYYFGFYERSNMNQASFDITSFDSFSSTDYGVVIMSSLKPFTEYVVRLENTNDGTVYYINYTTGESDTVKPFVEYVQTSGTQLEIFFNKRIDTSTINPENVIVSGKTGDFDEIFVSSGYMSQDVYIDFNLSYYESYDVTIQGVKDLSGNMMEPQTLSITARSI